MPPTKVTTCKDPDRKKLMNLHQNAVVFHKKEILELKDSILWKHEPVCKAFILGANDSPTEEEIPAYRQEHPHTKVVVLTRKDCGEGNTD